jgi:hypothetical protein
VRDGLWGPTGRAQRRGPLHHQPLPGPPSCNAPLSPRPQWVGTGRPAERCVPLPPVGTVRAPFTAYSRLPGPFPALPVRLLARMPCDPGALSSVEAPRTRWPFALCLVCPRSDYKGHADARHPLRRNWGLVSPPGRPRLSSGWRVSHVPRARRDGILSGGCRRTTSPRLSRLPSRRRVTQVHRRLAVAASHRQAAVSRCANCRKTHRPLAVPSGKVLRQGTTAP